MILVKPDIGRLFQAVDMVIVGEEPRDRTASGLWPSDHAGAGTPTDAGLALLSPLFPVGWLLAGVWLTQVRKLVDRALPTCLYVNRSVFSHILGGFSCVR